MLGWQTGPPRGMELCSMGKIKDWFSKVKLKEAEDKSKEKIKSIFKSTKNKDYQKIKSMECNLDERLSIMDRGIENEPQEEVEGDQEVETQEPEQGPSTEALSNQIKSEEPKSLAWYLDKAIKENKEWATFDPKKWEEWINRNLPPSSEYEDYVKNKNPQVNNLSLSPCPDFWKIDDEPENNKSYIWKQDEKSNWYMEEVNEAEKKENKISYKPIDTNGMLYQVMVNGSEIIEGPPINSREICLTYFPSKNTHKIWKLK
ncbi:hypothetical protein O181_121822 [Austropuccinia psidii MF-1]|uniref:Uncharacterized protein n=1 Tax=Austropuccinia psidii MF-1 TaxID=1389203 RepID=A0A9Q3KLW3_9BASI|nr:hypothetical protein [Austropuccinia psidii MF-1]